MTEDEMRKLMPPCSGIAPSHPEAVKRGLVGAMREVWTEPALLEFGKRLVAHVTEETRDVD